MTTPMTKEEFRDSLVLIAKQAYWEGRNGVGQLFENTTIYKQLMDYAEESNVVVNRIRKEML
jgi:hypothetical protein